MILYITDLDKLCLGRNQRFPKATKISRKKYEHLVREKMKLLTGSVHYDPKGLWKSTKHWWVDIEK